MQTFQHDRKSAIPLPSLISEAFPPDAQADNRGLVVCVGAGGVQRGGRDQSAVTAGSGPGEEVIGRTLAPKHSVGLPKGANSLMF